MTIILNGQQRELTDGLTIAELVRDLDLRPEHVAVELNRDLVPRAQHAEIRLADGDAALWETVRTKFETTQNPAEHRVLLQTLGAFQAPAMREKSLAYALTGPLKPQETLTVPGQIAETSEQGTASAYEWMTKNYGTVRDRLPPMLAVFMPYLGGGCSAERLTRAQAFFAEPAHAPAGTEKELAKMTEAVEDCVELRKREGERVKNYLHRTGAPN